MAKWASLQIPQFTVWFQKIERLIAPTYFLFDFYGQLDNQPYGVNYIARYSLCECIGSTFPQNVVGTVDIGADGSPVFCTVQTRSRPYPLPTKDVLFLIVLLVIGNRIKIKK